MLKLILITLLAISFNANAEEAKWTGKFELSSKGIEYKWDCEYNYNGLIFWRIYKGYCPKQLTVEE